MKILVVEDDFISRQVLVENLSAYGVCHVAVNGMEMLEAVEIAWANRTPYDLILLDIMMPGMDGQEALQRLRAMEQERGIGGSKMAKVIMTTALDDPQQVMTSFMKGGCEAYLVKPIDFLKLKETIRDLGLA
ncbi:MAG: response regulator [Thermodesulfobacteriota bacterium]